jgi:hypothetical protein
MSNLSESSQVMLLQPRSSIGGLYPDVVIEESHEDSLEITEHPVEQGAAISDHAFLKPRTLTIRGGASDSTSGVEGSAQEFYDKLLELQKSREPFDIVTGKRLYKNMLLATLSVVTDGNSGAALFFSAECREVIIVTTQVTSVPPRPRHANPNKTGETADKGQQQPRDSQLNAGLKDKENDGFMREGGAAPGYGD